MPRVDESQRVIAVTNSGKVFEAQIIKSLPNDYAKHLRLNDSTGMLGTTTNLRFSNKNPFDFMIWNSKQFRLYCLELKTKKNKS